LQIRLLRLVALTLILTPAVPGLALACACGCGIFDVGTSSMFAGHAGGMMFVEYDYLDQSHNWSGTSGAPAADNADKAIRSRFMTVGGQYQFNRSWGITLEVPYWHRYFQTTDAGSGQIVAFTHGAVGDVRLKVTYTGLSSDMSTGLTAGVKLANGETDYPGFDPDTQIGSGSTDLLLGAYHLGRLSADQRWSYYMQGQWDQPVRSLDNYHPGAEGVVVVGTYYEGWSTHSNLKFSPVAQLRAVYRRPDGGVDGMPGNTGYARVLISPGIEIGQGRFRVYADVALPLYTNARGNQLFAHEMWKLNVSEHF
jgi:hypothetical protein